MKQDKYKIVETIWGDYVYYTPYFKGGWWPFWRKLGEYQSYSYYRDNVYVSDFKSKDKAMAIILKYKADRALTKVKLNKIRRIVYKEP